MNALTDATDYTALWNDLREKISLVKSGNPTPGQGTFGHITGGYDAGYYGFVHTQFIMSQSQVIIALQVHLFTGFCGGHVRHDLQDRSVGSCPRNTLS
jgi:hypothetical protein